MFFLKPQLGQVFLLMCLGGLLQIDICRGQHMVHIQEGPLYRVKGYPMSISCNVSGLTSLVKQEFTMSFIKPENPGQVIEIISTDDRNFGYAMFAKRVREKEIIIERLSEISAIFQIMSLQAEDAGTYECYTPNKLSTYFGTYNARTELHVIEDTLKASYSGPESISISEGDTLQLECQVTSQTFQHTHLSVTWYLRGTTDTWPIIALDRDLTVKPGKAFDNRYISGFIAMEKVEDTTYRLKMSQVQHSDSGDIYCQAEEWIQDPDRSWIQISYKNTTSVKVEVKRIDIAVVGSFITQIKPLSGDFQEGDMMEIHCSVETQNLPGYFFSMTWLKDNMEMAEIGPSGVLSVTKNFMKREKDGELRAVKTGDKAYVLTIQPVRVEDQGLYQCKASQEERTDKGTFNRGQSQLSSKETVRIRTTESSLAVVMARQLVQVNEGETLQISCSVTGATGLLSVSWQHKKSTSSSFIDIITLSREGVMGTAETQYQQRGVRTFRPTAADFILELSGAVMSDSGEYMCTVSEWNMESNGNVKKVNSQQQRGDFSVKSIDSLVTAVLISRANQVTENSVIKLICSVRAPKVLLAVTWKFTPLNSTSQKDIMFLRHTGDMSYGDQRDYQLETEVQKSGVTFTLKVLRASKRHQGLYQCQIDAYERDVQKAKKLSNPLAVTVNRTASKLSLSSSTKSHLAILSDTNAKMDCLVTSSTFNSSRFTVTWIKGTQTLLGMQPEGVITLGPGTHLEMDERIKLRRTERQTFQLTIQQVKTTDSGQYLCSVEEWVQDPEGLWYILDKKSITMKLSVHEKESNLQVRKVSHMINVTDVQAGFTMECEIVSNSSDKSVFEVTWSRRQRAEQPMTIFTVGRDGTLHKKIPDRALVYNRPNATLFTLTVPDVSPSDDGLYQCQVVEWLHTASNSWRKVAEQNSGEVFVQVYPEESNLEVHKMSRTLNVTDRQTGFTVECEIVSYTSVKSVFEVTWSRRQREEQPMTIFTVGRDGILHKKIPDRSLVYDRPNATLFTLTVPDVSPSDNGWYQCQVVEWLHAASNSWRKVAEDNSEELSVHIHLEDGKEAHSSGIILGTTIPLFCLLLVIIVILLITLQKTKSALKRNKDTLWVEHNPLKPVPEVNAKECDSD